MATIPPPSYPTKSLRFLEEYAKINGADTDNESSSVHGRPATVPLHIIVVGAGLGGLSAAVALARRGHSVTVLEQAAELGEVNIRPWNRP
jgi:salicylate hydroxylase